MKRLTSLALPLIFTAGLLVYALWGVDLASLGATLVRVELWVIPPFLLLLAIFFISNAKRWATILGPFGRYSIRQVTPAMMIGFAGNNVLPLRIGELIRALIFAKEVGLSRSGVLMTLVAERALDLVGILLVFAIGVILIGEVPVGLTYGLIIALAGVGALMGALVLFARYPRVPLGLWARLSPRLPGPIAERGGHYLAELARGVAALGRLQTTLLLLLQSLLRWLIAAILVWLSLAGYGVEITPGLAMLVVGITAVAVSLPSVPGFVGPIQAAFVFALTPFGIPPEIALAASILFLIGHWLPITLIGAGFFISRHYSLRQLRREAEAPEERGALGERSKAKGVG